MIFAESIMEKNLKIKLTHEDIIFSDASLVDSFGRVFFYQGRIFRAVFEHQEEHATFLVSSELYKELQSKKYIPSTWKSDYQLDGYCMVLEHEYISKSQPHHWSFDMYKEAILLLPKINSICNKYGYELKDAHPYNIFFLKNTPIFIDFGSISKRRIENEWVAYKQYLDYCYLQLLIWCTGDMFLTRKLLEDGISSFARTIPMTNIFDSFFVKQIEDDLFDFQLIFRGSKIFNNAAYKTKARINKWGNRIAKYLLFRKHSLFTITKSFKNIDVVLDKIHRSNRPSIISAWQNYHDTYKKDNAIISTPRFDQIIQIVKDYAPDIKTAVDLAGNQGVFCNILNSKVKLDRIVLTDYDENAINSAFNYFKENTIDIEPYLFNFMIPLNKVEIDFVKSDIAFALAITHHLILTQGYLLSVIFGQIKKYSNKYVAIEFMPLGLWNGVVKNEVPDWYTVDWFREEFIKHFHLIKECNLESNRILFLGRNL